MTPTMKLRFIKRQEEECDIESRTVYTHTRFILQQWWESTPHSSNSEYFGEWRDIPVEDEE